MNIGIKETVQAGANQQKKTDFIGSGFFIRDDSFDGLVQKVKDKKNDKEARKGNKTACYDMVLTNYHVVRDVANKLKQTKNLTTSIKQIFAFEKSGMDIVLATGAPSAIRKSFFVYFQGFFSRYR